MSNSMWVEYLATTIFALAVVHTFLVKRFEHIAHAYPKNSVIGNIFDFLGEVEVVFGFWAGIFVVLLAIFAGSERSISYLEGVNFTEPAFVFVIMTIAATQPVIFFARRTIQVLARLLPLPREVAFFVTCLVIGPLLGSFITEPAAMTVTALLLKERYYDKKVSTRLMYATLGVLFVNVSIGGTLTHFAAPPVLMVAERWDWTTPYMLEHFGYKAAVAVVLNAAILSFLFRNELMRIKGSAKDAVRERSEGKHTPSWLILIHLLFLAAVVLTAHHMVAFMGIFLFFLGLASVTNKYQSEITLRESLLVGFFLGGLVVLGGPQSWWLKPLLTSLSEVPLFLGATALTALTDNAALTYLGSQVPGLAESMKYALVAGAVAGGGLTVIANAPNPAGFGILKGSFGRDGISPLGLLLNALPPTLIAMACLWWLPSL